MSRRIVIAVCLAAVLAAGCSDDTPEPGVVRAGQVDIKLPDGWTVDGPADARALATAGVDIIITNAPDVIARAIADT